MALRPQARACLRRPPVFHTLFGRHRCVDGVCHFPTRFSEREREGRKLRVMVVEERHRKRRRERMVHSSAVCWCVPTSTHTQWMCLASHTQREDKTRHGNGDTHTWGWMRRQDTTHKGGGKGREKTRGGSSQDTHHYTKEKEKRQKDNDHAQRQ